MSWLSLSFRYRKTWPDCSEATGLLGKDQLLSLSEPVSASGETRMMWPSFWSCYRVAGDEGHLPLLSVHIIFPAMQKTHSNPLLPSLGCCFVNTFSTVRAHYSLNLMSICWLLGMLLEVCPVHTSFYKVEFALWWKEPEARLCPWQITDTSGFSVGLLFARQMQTALSCCKVLC